MKIFTDRLSRGAKTISLIFVVVTGACATVLPRPLPPLPNDSEAELQGAYKGTQNTYETCGDNYVAAQQPWQLYAGAGTAVLGVAAMGSAAGLMAVPDFDPQTRVGLVAGLGAVGLLSAGGAALFAGQTLAQWSRAEAYKQVLEQAGKRSADAIATRNSMAMIELTRELNEDCRVVYNSNDATAAFAEIQDLQRWRQAAKHAEDATLATQKKLQVREQGLAQAEAERKQLGKNLAALQSDFAERESQNANLRGELRRLEDERASLSKKQQLLLDEKRKLEEKNNHYEDVAKALAKEVKNGRVALRRLRNGVIVEMPNKVLFPSGSAELNEIGQETLTAVAGAIASIKDRRIRIEGHTDNVPVGKKLPFANNWELSAARAITVTSFLQEQGVNPSLMSAEARGQYAPMTSNASPEGRARNRRIEIYLVPKPEGDRDALRVDGAKPAHK